MDAGEHRRTEGPEKDNLAIGAPSISLRRGGRAIRGIGERFAANPVTDTGSMRVPIPTSPGRSGFGPQPSLSYDSGARNAPLGAFHARGPASRRRIRALTRAILGASFVLLLSRGDARADLADVDYRVAFPIPPTDGFDALTSLGKRATTVIKFMACGDEIAFLKAVAAKDSDEDILGFVIAKVSFLTGMPDGQNHKRITDTVCKQTVQLRNPADALPGERKDLTADEWNDLISSKGALLNAKASTLFPQMPPQMCTVITDVRQVIHAPDNKISLDVDYTVSAQCLRIQVNEAVRLMSVKGQLGSSGLPCYGNPLDLTEGEWDVSVRDLMRVYYLDALADGTVLQSAQRNHIVNDLFTLGTRLGPESYSWLQCGNTEEETGSPRDRADERDWGDDAWDDLWNAFKWLLRRLIYAVVLFLVALALVLTFGLAGILVAAVVAVAAVAGWSAQIPETENHRMMIETSRYLNNQIILKDLRKEPQHPNLGKIEADQEELRKWLHSQLQNFLKRDFEEYNARPYQRYSLTAILNLHDFAVDRKLKEGAQMVLEYSAAKFALGSNQGRRIIPFRRLVKETRQEPLFDQFSGGDHSTSLLLLYAGQTQQLPNASLISETTPADMVRAATSSFAPHPLIVDIAIRKEEPYYQRIHHAGVEIYMSRKSFLLSAGGILTGHANRLEILGVPTFGKPDDRGAAVQTVLIPTAGKDLRRRDQFIRIEGPQVNVGDGWSKDHNICLWGDFACGLNIAIPPMMNSCLKEGPPGTSHEWRFLDSTHADCALLKDRPDLKFYAVIFREDCPSSDHGCETNWGFIETVDAPTVDFSTFQSAVLMKNPPGSITSASAGGSGSRPIKGSYRSFSGHEIQFDITAHEADSKKWGIVAIDGNPQGSLTTWDLASGPVMQAKGDGMVQIVNLRLNKRLVLDYSEVENPTRL